MTRQTILLMLMALFFLLVPLWVRLVADLGLWIERKFPWLNNQ